jgi:alpha-galactosidase
MPSAMMLALATIPAVLGLQLPGGVGKLPALGWNSWVRFPTDSILPVAYWHGFQNAYGCDIDETRILQAANAMKDKGFQAAGYEYVNSDDCWSQMTGRDAVTHQLLPNFTKW